MQLFHRLVTQPKCKLSDINSLYNNLLANEIQDIGRGGLEMSLEMFFFFGGGGQRVYSQRKCLHRFILQLLSSTDESVWPWLKMKIIALVSNTK